MCVSVLYIPRTIIIFSNGSSYSLEINYVRTAQVGQGKIPSTQYVYRGNQLVFAQKDMRIPENNDKPILILRIYQNCIYIYKLQMYNIYIGSSKLEKKEEKSVRHSL